MISGKRVCAVVPARGGSKGIPRKNLCRVEGLTLVEWAIRLARSCSFVDSVYVSTDDPETYAVAVANQAATPNLRPAELATDAARSIDLVGHFLDTGLVGSDDCILLLQPTTPLRTQAELVAVCIELDSQWESADAIVSVCESSGANPFKAQLIEDGYLRSLLKQDATVPRQSLPATFIPNGAFYLGKVDVLRRENTFMPLRTLPFMMSDTSSINLDGPLDLVLLEAMLGKGLARMDATLLTQADK